MSWFSRISREISLLDLDLEAISFHFSFSISILRHFHFTFHSRSRYQGIFISLFILEMSETDFHFTFHFSKWVKQIFISLFTSRFSNIHSRRTLIPSLICATSMLYLETWKCYSAIKWRNMEISTCILSNMHLLGNGIKQQSYHNEHSTYAILMNTTTWSPQKL